jgi:hypothetical protein
LAPDRSQTVAPHWRVRVFVTAPYGRGSLGDGRVADGEAYGCSLSDQGDEGGRGKSRSLSALGMTWLGRSDDVVIADERTPSRSHLTGGFLLL